MKKQNLNIPKVNPVRLAQFSVAIIILLVLYKVYRELFPKKSEKEKQYVELIEKPIPQEKLSYTKSLYQNFAAEIRMALSNVFNIQNDQEGIYAVFKKMNSTDDVLQLILAFGDKGFWTGPAYGKLYEAINRKLPDSQIEEINKILFNKGIKYTF